MKKKLFSLAIAALLTPLQAASNPPPNVNTDEMGWVENAEHARRRMVIRLTHTACEAGLLKRIFPRKQEKQFICTDDHWDNLYKARIRCPGYEKYLPKGDENFVYWCAWYEPHE